MKTMNLKVMRSFIRKEVGVAILSIILVGFLFPSKIQAKEFFNSVAIKNIDNSNSVNSTTYFLLMILDSALLVGMWEVFSGFLKDVKLV